VDRKVNRTMLFRGVYEPTGEPLQRPTYIHRALTREDWAVRVSPARPMHASSYLQRASLL
jgi:hypothetical protein